MTEKKIVITFGRFSPIHKGHEAVVNTVVSKAKQLGADHRIYASHSFDTKKNPLPYDDKITYMKQMFPKANIVHADENNMYHIMRKVSDEGYKHVTVVAGEDRLSEYDQIKKYIKDPKDKDFDPKKHYAIKSFNVVSAGNRDEKAAGVQGYSGTKMREYVKNKDFRSFATATPGGNPWLARKVFKTVKKNLAETEQSTMNTNAFWLSRQLFKTIQQNLWESTDKGGFEPLLHKFVKQMCTKMNIKNAPEVKIIDGKGIKTFGMYYPGEKKVEIVVKNRHPLDIMRTLAHELMHHKQNEDGRLGNNIAAEGSTGSEIENEANATAGVILRNIGAENPDMFASNAITESYLEEGLHDLAKGKAVLMAGGPASGKDFVISNVLGGLGFINVTSDQALEMLMDKEGLDKKMPDAEMDKRDVVRARAKKITAKREELILKNKLGMIVNGTSDDPKETLDMKKKLESLGYETQMVFVNTADEVSMMRNIERNQLFGGRTVPEKIRAAKWKDAQKSKELYQKEFGDNFHEVVNDADLRSADPMTRERQYDHFYDVHRKLRKFVYSKPGEKPKQEPQQSQQMYAGTQPKAKEKPEESMLAHARRLGLRYFGFGRYGRKVDGKNKVTHTEKDGKLVQLQAKLPLKEEHGAGDEGTDKLVKKYADETPGQSYNVIKAYKLRKQIAAEETVPDQPEEKKKVSTKTIRRKFQSKYPGTSQASRYFITSPGPTEIP